MRTILLLVLASFTTFAIAEPKKLVCETTPKEEEERLRFNAQQYREIGDSDLDIMAKEFDESADGCKNADYGILLSFIFDTEGLSNVNLANVEIQQNYLCGADSRDVIKGVIEATPSVITFKWPEGVMVRAFNVDRQTLKSGFNTQRDMSCELLDVDTSKNLL